MAGIEKRLTHVAFLPARIVEHSLRYIRPACAFRCKRMAQRSFEKVTGLVKAAATHRVKLMTQRLRRRKRTLPSAHSLPLENRLGLRFIDRANQPPLSNTQKFNRSLPVQSNGSAFIPMTQHQFRALRVTTAVGNILL